MRTVSGPNDMPLTASPVMKTCGTKPLSKDLFDRCNAARLAKSDVNNHQIRVPTRSRRHRIGRHWSPRRRPSDQAPRAFPRAIRRSSRRPPRSVCEALSSNNLSVCNALAHPRRQCDRTTSTRPHVLRILPRPCWRRSAPSQFSRGPSGSFRRAFDDPKLMVDAV